MQIWCLQIDQKTNEIFVKISTLASKKRSNQKNKGTLSVPLIGWFYFDYFTLLFWFDLFLEARVEIFTKILLVFWEIWRHQKDILKLTDLYASVSIFRVCNFALTTESLAPHFHKLNVFIVCSKSILQGMNLFLHSESVGCRFLHS